MSRLSVCQTVQQRLCFISGVAMFQNPTLQRHLGSSGGGSPCIVASASLLQKTATWQHSRSEFMIHLNTQPEPGIADICQHFCSCNSDWTAWWCPQGPLSMERLHHLSQVHSQQRNYFSPGDPGDPRAACCWGSALLYHQSTVKHTRHKPGNVAHL